MANTYYDKTGVLVLKEVTPVIKALFDPYDLDASHPGNGEAYIASMSETSSANWESVTEGLETLCEELGLEVKAESNDQALVACLYALSDHFKQGDNYDLGNLIDHHDFSGDDDADIEVLFLLARAFDDGHGLSAIKLEAAWHCDRPRLFEFGGNGEYYGRNFTMSSSSTRSILVGATVDEALEAGDIDEAAKRLAERVESLLAGVSNTDTRQALREKVLSIVSAASDKPAAESRLPRVLITVSGGIADYVADPGIDVEIFDHDNHEDDPEGAPGVPEHFRDLAAPNDIPVAGDDDGEDEE